MNANQAVLDLNADVEFAVEQADVRLMTIDELSMVGGGNDCATLG